MARRLLVLAAASAALLAAPAAAVAHTEADAVVQGWNAAPGPSPYSALDVSKYGPTTARTVLVLVPGTNGGRGDFTLTARQLVKDVPGLAVWAVDRRSEPLEDTSMFTAALQGKASLQQMYDYYVGWLANPAITDHYQPPDLKTLGFAADWGLKVQLEDVRRVVRAAAKGGRQVILGGHSLGASVAVAYASWDFNGHPGYEDLSGLVLIDGGLRGAFHTAGLAEAKQRLAAIRRQPFLDLLGLGLPWVTGVLSETAAILADKAPQAPSMLQTFPLLPADFKPPVPVTNRGALGYAFDASTSPKALGLIQVRAGRLGADGDWIDGEVTPIERLAQTFGQEPANAVEWFYPSRLNLDVDVASPLQQDRAATYLGLRLKWARHVDLPLYALQTSLTHGAVLRGAKRFIAMSKTPRSRTVLVDASATESHLDPLTAAPATNTYLKTVTPFLRRLVK